MTVSAVTVSAVTLSAVTVSAVTVSAVNVSAVNVSAVTVSSETMYCLLMYCQSMFRLNRLEPVFFHNGQEMMMMKMMINEVNTMTTDLRSRCQKNFFFHAPFPTSF